MKREIGVIWGFPDVGEIVNPKNIHEKDRLEPQAEWQHGSFWQSHSFRA